MNHTTVNMGKDAGALVVSTRKRDDFALELQHVQFRGVRLKAGYALCLGVMEAEGSENFKITLYYSAPGDAGEIAFSPLLPKEVVPNIPVDLRSFLRSMEIASVISSAVSHLLATSCELAVECDDYGAVILTLTVCPACGYVLKITVPHKEVAHLFEKI